MKENHHQAVQWDEIEPKLAVDADEVAKIRDEILAEARAYRLAELRPDLGLTQGDLAEQLHLSQSRVSRIERGDLDRTEVGTLKAYAEALGAELHVSVRVGDEIRVLA